MPITYNGYEFSNKATISCQMAPEYDGTGQVIVAHVYTLTIVDFVFPGQPIAGVPLSCQNNKQSVEDATQRLMVAGKELRVPDNIGLGTERFIQGGGPSSSDFIHDVNGGPHPQSCDIKNIGAGVVSQITYVIRFSENPCGYGTMFPAPKADTTDVKAFNWSNTFQINNSGYTTRTTTGYVEIQNIMIDDGGSYSDATRQAYLADQLRGYVLGKFLPIDNFERSFNWQMTPDHKRLNFTITDAEIQSPNAYPADVVSISMPTGISFKWPTADNSKSQISIRFRIKLSQLAPRVRAWEIFDSLLERRLGGFIAGGNKGFLILNLSVEEDWFSNEYSFAVSATATSSIYDQMGQLNLFSTLDDDWNTWAGSLYFERAGLGLQGLKAGNKEGLPPDDGRQAKLCGDLISGDFSDDGEIMVPPPKFVFAACSDPPSPGESWLNTDYNLIEAPRLQVMEAQEYRPVTTRVLQNPATAPTSTDSTMIKVEGTPKNCISEAPPSNRWQFEGYTQRVFYKIPPPVITEISGIPVKLVGEPKFRTRYLGKMFCLPVYEAEWQQEYVAKEPTGAPDSDYINPTPNGQPSGDTEGGTI